MRADGVLCDVHGVLYVHPGAIPGSVNAVRRLVESGIPHVFLTNSTQMEKARIVHDLVAAGFPLDADRVVTAAEAAGDYLEHHRLTRVGWLCAPDLARDIPGVECVPPEAGAGPVDAVLVGDLHDGFTYDVLNIGFRWLLEGASLIALARNRYYQHAHGLMLDGGPFVRLLEEASGVAAHVVGKPNPAFFRAGLDRLGKPASRVVMIGDDLEGDVLPAMALGMTGVQVGTGKYREAHYQAAPWKADHLAADLAGAVDWILGGEAG